MQMFARLKADFTNPGSAVASGSWLDWFIVGGLIILVLLGWNLILSHLKGASL